MKTVFVNGQVWDGESDRAVPADVLIDGSRIEAAGVCHKSPDPVS